MKALVEYLVSALLDSNNFSVTEENESEKVVILKVAVNKEDIGKVIGKNGTIANSIRTLVKSTSAKSGKRYIVKISENQ